MSCMTTQHTQRWEASYKKLLDHAGCLTAGEAESTGPFFQEDVDIFVGRAPGRLDVMGGIADYSGSLVLQLPLAVACHAAVQMSPTSGAVSSNPCNPDSEVNSRCMNAAVQHRPA